MIGRRKKFSQELHDRYDEPLRIRVLKEYPKYYSNPDKYGVDLLSSEIDKPAVELQVCTWWHIDYPKDFLIIYERKRKWLKKGIVFWIFNDMMNMFYEVKGEDVKEEYLQHYFNNEYAYHIPLSVAKFNLFSDFENLL